MAPFPTGADPDERLLARVRDCHGAVRRADLHPTRADRRRIDALIDGGDLELHRHGTLSLPGCSRLVLLARIHGGVIAGHHAAAYHQLPLPSRLGPITIVIPHGGRMSPLGRERLRSRRGLALPDVTAYPVLPLAETVANLLQWDPDDELAVVAADAPLKQGTVTLPELIALLSPPRFDTGRRRLAMTSTRSRSPIETLARLRLRAAGLEVDEGVVIRGIGEVDLVVNGWLVIELDGFDYHSDMWSLEQDDARSRDVARLGLVLIRFTGRQVRTGSFVGEVLAVIAAHPGATRLVPRGAGPFTLSR